MANFDAPEKKCELRCMRGAPSLRSFGETFWREIVEKSKAQIISSISNDACDAYLLSESSLFVFSDKVIMITCGRTDLAYAMAELIKILGTNKIDFFTYERKTGYFPLDQPFQVQDDLKLLKSFLPLQDFTFNEKDFSPVYFAYFERKGTWIENDQTFEILMHDLHPETLEIFGKQKNELAKSDALLELHALISDYQKDEFFFDPHGYSLNAIMNDAYLTVHVTPQAESSYISLETNQKMTKKERDTFVSQIIALFRPKRFDYFHFESDRAPDKLEVVDFIEKESWMKLLGKNYRLLCNHFYQVDEV